MRLLIIEDHQKLADSLKSALEAESYAVDAVYDGQTGYEQAESQEYDLILLDLGLPKLDGLAVSRKLREDGIKTPILMLTAKDTITDKVSGLNVGADDYLVKPFDFNELLARIRALLRRGQPNQPLTFAIDTLNLDPVSKRVTRREQIVNLSAKEYALLEFLCRHQGKIVSKTQIIDHVWDNELDPFSRIVDVYIGYLRKKIDKAYPKEKPLITTIKGLGYRLEG